MVIVQVLIEIGHSSKMVVSLFLIDLGVSTRRVDLQVNRLVDNQFLLG